MIIMTVQAKAAQQRRNSFKGGGRSSRFASGASEKNAFDTPPLAYLGRHKTGYYSFQKFYGKN